MKNKLAFISGMAVIIMFLGSIIWSAQTAKKLISTDKEKSEYYNLMYGINKDEIEPVTNEPVALPPQQYVLDTESTQYTGIELIRSLHLIADNYLTNGKIDKYATDNTEAWDEILATDLLNEAKYEAIKTHLENIVGMADDMNNLLDLTVIAATNKDAEALRYMHRILHDLDLYAFRLAEKSQYDFWGATQTAPAGSQAQYKEITSYISEHKVN